LDGKGDKREERPVATISTSDFKNGMGLKINGKYYTIVEFQHVKPGKGGAFVRYKIKDLQAGRTIDQTCNAGTKFESVQLITKEMQYLYNDGTAYYFMDNETFEQIPVDVDFIGDNTKWLKENDNCLLLYADTELLGVQPPMFIEVEITETDPGFKGDTVQGGTKPATIETGAVIQVPMYLNQGETVRVDTRDGKFVARV
jgi:elongation factor P